MGFRKIELKNRYVFLAIRKKSVRTLKVKATSQTEATELARKKLPDWSNYPANPL